MTNIIVSEYPREWSCEHCGVPNTDHPHDCETNGCQMCDPCTDIEDVGDPCPVDQTILDEQTNNDAPTASH